MCHLKMGKEGCVLISHEQKSDTGKELLCVFGPFRTIVRLVPDLAQSSPMPISSGQIPHTGLQQRGDVGEGQGIPAPVFSLYYIQKR